MIVTASQRPTGKADPEILIQQRLHGSGELQALAMRRNDLQQRLGSAQQKLQEAIQRRDKPSPEEIQAVAEGAPVDAGNDISDRQREVSVLRSAEAAVVKQAEACRRQIAVGLCEELAPQHREQVEAFVRAGEALERAFDAMDGLGTLLRRHDLLQSNLFPMFGRYLQVRPGLRYAVQEYRDFLESTR